MGKDFRLSHMVLFAALASGATSGSAMQADNGDSGNGDTVTWEAARSRIDSAGASDARTEAALNEWRRLSQSDGFGFAAYANFLLSNPGWPGESHFRDVAEKSVNPAADSALSIANYFARYPATTATGKARSAVALANLGRMDEARVLAREAWVAGTMPNDDEQRLLVMFSGSFSADDYLRRADALLWRNQTTAAERILPYLAPTRQPLIAARIAFQRKAADAALKMGAADPIGVTDPGYLADKATWLRDSGNSLAARQLLASRAGLTQYPSDAEKWYETLLGNAKAAANDTQWTMAYAIASKVDDAFPVGTDVSDKALGVRDDYTSLTWLAGTAALNHLSRPGDAEAMFNRYAHGARSPSTITKGLYWAGRAAAAAGHASAAQGYFEQAGTYADQYYGQLALERLGRPIPKPADADRPVALSAADRDAYIAQPIVRVARLLGERGQWADQTKFIRALAANAQTDRDHFLATELSRSLGRPDLGVMVGRRALASGLSGYGSASFPKIRVPEGQKSNWTMIHAIARQESQFDRAIVSYAGARGLMQLMPATAREVAGKLSMSYDQGSLFDPNYNVMLGSTYFRHVLGYYNGSYPLAVAAYNAGMGNVNKWLRANGDPRLPGGDIVQWIEDIPIWQTKDYVQRVLENAVVYDLMNPAPQMPKSTAPLSAYLGKKQPG